MPHTPGAADVMVLIFWIVAGGLILRAVCSWLLGTRRIEKRQDQLEALLRAIATGLNIELPKADVRRTLLGRIGDGVDALSARLRRLFALGR